MNDNKGKKHTLRMAWLLFSDLITRINILSDECAHLQDTIFGFLNHVDAESLGINRDDQTGATERQWVAANLRETIYYDLPNQERTLLNLWNSIGSLAEGIDLNRTQIYDTFQNLAEDIRSTKTNSNSLYRFATQRSHFIHRIFSFYTRKIGHAHQQLVHLLENMPGVLPNPLLLRRWNSAAYGEFLSDYSRHVNWQTQVVIWNLANDSTQKDEVFEEFDKWRNSSFLTHTWDHLATSLAQNHTLSTNADGEGMVGRFGAIWSTFFYLEQPALFPLLYHECAHLNFNCVQTAEYSSVTSKRLPSKSTSSANKSTFLDSRFEAAETLKALVRFESLESRDDFFWHQFTEEVWADAVSVVLGGAGYISALFLQLFAHSGADAYQEYDVGINEWIPLNKFGTREMEIREVPWPLDRPAYFWEARLLVAIQVLEWTHTTSQEWQLIGSIRQFLEEWDKDYLSVNHSSRTSKLHESLASSHRELNYWVANCCIRCLDTVKSTLGEFTRVDAAYLLDDKAIRQLINSAVGAYVSSVFPQDECDTNERPPALPEQKPIKLEDVSITVRWYLSEFVADKLLTAADSGSLRKFIESYSTYMRNDGSSAFRLGLEWCVAKRELYLAAADSVAPLRKDVRLDGAKDQQQSIDINKDSGFLAVEKLAGLKAALLQDVNEMLRRVHGHRKVHDDDKGVEANRSAHHLRRRLYSTESRLLPNSRRKDLTFTNRAVTQYLGEFSDYMSGACPINNHVKIGTLYLGVLRPSGFSQDDPHPYWKALMETERYFSDADELLKRKSLPGAKFSNSFAPLIGDYSFVSFCGGVTPVERDCHPRGLQKMLLKPRLVLQVLCSPRESGDDSDLLKCPPGCSLGRISLLKFRYRWQWVDLCKKVTASRSAHFPSLFLSSGWEDAILISWHCDERSYWQSADELGLTPGNDIDCQSNVIYPALLDKPDEKNMPKFSGNNKRQAWSSNLLTWEYESKNKIVSLLNERSGRYDYTVLWARDSHASLHQGSADAGDRIDPDLLLRDFARIQKSLPFSFWAHIRSISTSFERSTGMAGQSAVASHVLMHTF